jgi:hypothetical protein
MARSKRDSKPKVLRYFFLNGKIHKVIRSSRAKDELVAWCYPDKKRVMYSYSDAKKNMEKAYPVAQVAEFLNRHRVTIQDYILDGKIPAPSKIYPIGDPDNKEWYQYMFSEKDILGLHEFLLESGHSSELPSRAELKALLKTSFILYTKTEEGKFIPVWKAE